MDGKVILAVKRDLLIALSRTETSLGYARATLRLVVHGSQFVVRIIAQCIMPLVSDYI